ncbi:zinc finger domain-containing protein [Streptomyces niveus]|uniref:zinc finger domain-containing protein n=1 Tax=Streptomyces niveus TaxID=193462 RepID=UPI0034252919
MITFEEAGRLLGLAAARDQRTVGDADILAWHADLNAAGVTLPVAEQALTRFYAKDMASLEPDQRRRVTTPDIIGIARKIRAERVADFVYEPPPGDEDPHYLRRLRGQLEATANGLRPAVPEQAAIESGAKRDVQALLGQVGRSVSGELGEETPAEVERVRRPGPLGVECPTCQAAIGRPCKAGEFGGNRRPRELRNPHAARGRVARGEPASLESPEEIERRRAASRAHLARLAAERDIPDAEIVEDAS